MLMIIVKSLYFFLPAYVANMAPVIFKKIPYGGNAVWKKKLGAHKTWRGVISATIMGGVTFGLQKMAYVAGFKSWALIDYADFGLMLGFLLGFGAIFGDMVKSYFKRKAEIKPGESWLFFDQTDFVIGGILFSWILYVPNASVAFILLLISPVLHIFVNQIGYSLGLRSARF